MAANLPVLFLDTCSIVDPIRAPLRPGDLPRCIEAAQELLQLISTAPARYDLSRQLRDAAIRLDQDQDCIIRAHGRASTYTPPSRKGGEVKDSTIIEECLEVSRRLQTGGFGRKRVFCTSNTKDDCEGRRLLPMLAVDFGTAGLGFATNLPWAVHEIRTA